MNSTGLQHFIFSAPFRTNIEMNTFSALSADKVDGHIREVVGELGRTEGGDDLWTTGRDSGQRGELVYANLDESVLPRKAKPIACLQVRSQGLERIAKDACAPSGATSLDISDCGVRYYDDTIAILVCRVSVGGLRTSDAGSISNWSTGFCKSLIDRLRSRRLRLESALLARSAASKNQGLLSRQGHLSRFTDRNEPSAANDGDTMLWVNRIMVSEREPNREAIAEWSQIRPTDADWLDLSSMRLLACVGNSVLAGPPSDRDASVTIDAVALCTYFYVSQDLFRQRLKELHLEVARAAKGVSRSNFSDEKLGELRDHVVVMEGEFGDCRLGLQGHAHDIASRLLEAWNYEALASAVERRSASLETVWSLWREKRRRKYEGALRFVLTIIAGAAVMEFCLSLFVAAGDGKVAPDSVPGLMDAARLVAPDLTLYLALVLVLLLPILVVLGRK